MTSRSDLTLEQRVERALITAARIVDMHGDVYVPIFERLERELLEIRRKGSAAERARMIARGAPLVTQICADHQSVG